MSEKRFKGYAEKTGQHFELIINDLLGEEYSLTDDFFKSKDVIFEIVDLLNVMNDTLLKQAKENHKLSNENDEQQDKITELEKNFEDLVNWSTEISKRNVLLDEKIGRLQEEEKLYAQEILRLNELLKQYQANQDLGGGY